MLVKTNYQDRRYHQSEEQQEQLCQELESRIYLTEIAVTEHIREAFSIHCSTSKMRDLLQRLGYKFKSPILVPGNLDRELQETLADQYTRTRRKSLPMQRFCLLMPLILSTTSWLTCWKH